MSLSVPLIMSKLCLLCTVFTLCVWRGSAQNLNNVDTLEPRLYVSPDRASPTLEGVNDYFGWTAIFHALNQSTETMKNASDKIRVIIGAPYGTFPGGLPYNDSFLPRENRTGLVYSCPVSLGNCEGVRGNVASYITDEGRADNRGASVNTRDPFPPTEYCEGRMFDQAPNAFVTASNLMGRTLPYDDKQGQLMGAFLYSSEKVFMACAPRWRLVLGLNPMESISTRGMCYSSGPDLKDFMPRMACSSNAVQAENNNGDLQCLSGHSAVVNDGHFVIGVPGYDKNKGLLASQPTNATPTDDFTLGDFIARSQNNIPIADDDNRGLDQYQGFQVINAFIINPNSSNMSNLVTSVPRAGIKKNGRLHVYASPTDLSTPIFTNATGDQIGEFFGYSLEAGDFDNDGYDEVIVGSPMYTDFSTNRIERGRVYIFRTIEGELSSVGRIVIDGPSSLPRRARFGSSLTTLGDVDRDGYIDFAVGAPYYRTGSSSNTGAVFIYYGRADMDDIPRQTPFMITADTMATNVALSGDLLTFGFSLSSGHDVDSNGYNDLLVGAYESQSVFLLRSLPVAEITVGFVPHSTVNIESVPSFELEIAASINGMSVADTVNVIFEVREVVQMTPRVYFDIARTPNVPGRGVFRISQLDVNATTNVTVYTESNVGDFSPLIFNITLVGVERNVSSPVSGSEPLTDLSSFPRLIFRGQNMTQVDIVNSCGTDGCKSDVLFSNVSSTEIEVVANGPPLRSVTVTVMNNGSEPALNLELTISSIPDYITTINSDVFTCERNGSLLTCLLSRRRFDNGESVVSAFEFGFDTSLLTGNEMDSEINFRLHVPNMSQNEDTNTENNDLTVTFNPTAMADISISSIEFSPSMHEYTAVAPTDTMFLNEGVFALDTEITLVVTVGNKGPSTIQNATLDVFFPSRAESITGSTTFLYPYDIRSGPLFTCNRTLLDPAGYQRIAGRSKRSVSPQERSTRRMHKWKSSTNPRLPKKSKSKRQAMSSFDLDCTPDSPTRTACSMFTCSIMNLRRDNVSISFHSRLDERFFSRLPESGRKSFNLRAYAAVRLDNDYITGDGDNNNNNMAGILLEPFTPEREETDLLHVILWPVLGSFLVLAVLTVILYFCGFFRRKKKPVDGDLDMYPPENIGEWKSYNPSNETNPTNETNQEGEEEM